MNPEFSLHKAQQALQENNLASWIVNYLYTQGNNHSLASRIERAELKIADLREIPLNKFVRIIGPEEGMVFHEPAEVMESRVVKLMEAIAKGEQFPPLVVTDFWKLGTIQDGAHRFEALKRSGYETYPAVVLFEKNESLIWLEA